MDTVVDIISAFVVLFLALQFAQWFYGKVYGTALRDERDAWLRYLQNGEPLQLGYEVPTKGGRGSPEWREQRKARRKAEHEEFEQDYEDYKNWDTERAIQARKQAEEVEVLHKLMKLDEENRASVQYRSAMLLMQMRRQERMFGIDERTRWNADGTNNEDWMI